MSNYHKVDKSEEFITDGKTLITEVESDKYLKQAREQRLFKMQQNETRQRWS